MPQHKKKLQELHQAFKPIFTSSKTLETTVTPTLSQDKTVDFVPQNTSNPVLSLQEKLVFYHQKAAKKYNYIIPLEHITDSKLVEKQICEYIAQMSKKKNSSEYKAKSVKQAVDAINRHLVKISPIRGINLHYKYEFPDL
ncbi:hypothetical protein GLOIN_2v1784543 [Rhizophagus clarus]|uniref:Uncharacterized protein n=1 Tax=Rhizophagus clarus TaxID=94130 RepID=A0A8H3KRV5_9GLOM|nr:hypothetical protein GLOIN_2v1784543 [Rhizophagus clarus]